MSDIWERRKEEPGDAGRAEGAWVAVLQEPPVGKDLPGSEAGCLRVAGKPCLNAGRGSC